MYSKVYKFTYAILMATGLVGCGQHAVSPQLSGAMGIVNGQVVKAKDDLARSVVAFLVQTSEGEALCTATILDSETILTAAHCVEGNPTNMKVIFNRRIKGTKEANIRQADRFVQHPLWKKDSKEGRGDLAVVHFIGGLPRGYQAVTLAPASTELATGQEILLLGYGVSNVRNDKGAGTLRQIRSKIIGDTSPTELATNAGDASVCFGDSGGPAFIKQGESYLQWGVTSAVLGQACMDSSLHTVVMPYEPWITATAEELSKGGKAPAMTR